MRFVVVTIFFGAFLKFGSAQVPDSRCSTFDFGDAVALPHETDCTKFYKCSWGLAYEVNCPLNLNFNSALQTCDWPDEAGCDTKIEEPDCETKDGDLGCGIKVDEPTDFPIYTTDDFELTTRVLDPRCPVDNSGDVVHLPHEYDCTKFYKCDWGVPILFTCPPGLLFNRALQVCDWPSSAGCDDSEIPTGIPTLVPPTVTAPTTTTDIPIITTSDLALTSPDGVDPRCPIDNSGFVVHLPHEYDCTKFYKCDWGIPILFTCPPGLHFNRALQVCDWPSSAGCDDSEIPTGIPTLEPPTVTAPTTTTDIPIITTSDLALTSPDGVDPRCPIDNSGYVVHLPHEYDCTKFYKCDWGIPILSTCPPGLHFNRALQVCDWPSSAGCDDSEIPTGIPTLIPPTVTAPTTTTISTLTTSEFEATITDSTVTASTPTAPAVTDSPPTAPIDGKDPRCPLDMPEYTTNLPHETDCSKFYTCNWGYAILQSCPSGLHFNRDLGVCDWPFAAGCDPGNVLPTAPPIWS